MNRRLFLKMSSCSSAFLLSSASLVQAKTDYSILQESWGKWKFRFLKDDGRVVDAYQGGASHSEGQGYGLLLAAFMNDVEACEKIYAWTMSNLAIRSDSLLAWRWFPNSDDPVQDLNNSSDGDLFFAWACLKIANQFGKPNFHLTAQMIVNDLLSKCVTSDPRNSQKLILLPAAFGFKKPEGIIYNPSYPMPRALRELADGLNMPILEKLCDDSLSLLAEISLSGATPDWIGITDAGLRLVDSFSYSSGYEAVRVPLFLVWSKENFHPSMRLHTQLYARWTKPTSEFPVVFNRTTGEVEQFSDDIGYKAIASFIQCVASQNYSNSDYSLNMPPFNELQPYYPATLHMMALLAQIEGFETCQPS